MRHARRLAFPKGIVFAKGMRFLNWRRKEEEVGVANIMEGK
jgi:hypothetical protein